MTDVSSLCRVLREKLDQVEKIMCRRTSHSIPSSFSLAIGIFRASFDNNSEEFEYTAKKTAKAVRAFLHLGLVRVFRKDESF